jgi:hypothetical protein
MPSIFTADTPTNPATDGALIVVASTPRECAYCGALIASGQPWVREKIHEPFTADGPRYRRYHADLFAGEELSCWEKHELERENTRIALRAA